MTLLLRSLMCVAGMVCLGETSHARAPTRQQHVVVCQTLDDAANISHAVGAGDLSRWVVPQELSKHTSALPPILCEYRAEVEIAEVHGTPSAPGVIAVSLRGSNGTTVFVVPIGRPENIFRNRMCELPSS